MRIAVILIFLLAGCTHSPKLESPQVPVKAEWIQQSDQFAEEFTKAYANLRPEIGSELGYSEFNHLGLLLDFQTEERDRKFLSEWLLKLKSQELSVSDAELKIDIQVLGNWIQNQISNIDVYRSVREVEFVEGVRFVYQYLQFLLSDQSTPESKSSAVSRFKIYVHGNSNHQPLLEAMQSVFRARLKQYQGQNILAPYKGEVEQYLKDSASVVSGIRELLAKSGRSDWDEDFQKFAVQAKAYDEFTKNIVLPMSRSNSRLPKLVYAQILKRRGIDAEPSALIQRALSDYKTIYRIFSDQAKQIAHKHNLSKSNPAAVIQFLKSQPITDPKEVEKLYHEADRRLEKIMRENDLISVPSSPLKIRVAGEAESRMVPVPHLNPPPLVSNKGERPEFVVPGASGGLPFDDFSSPYSAIVLTAHEGRPGHDMQFSQMLDRGISVIRSRYAVNNVNIEGWALFAEDLVYPYLAPEERFFATQTRLWRVARMFLDPQLQLGQISDQRVLDVFIKELGVSRAMAGLELNRYKFNDIGQAPSYYFGYLIVNKMRDDAKKRLGSSFNLRCFNDKLLSFGLLPLRISSDRMERELTCTAPATSSK